MQEYNFEYTNRIYAIKLMSVVGAVFVLSMFLSAKIFISLVGFWPCMLFAVVAPVVIYVYGKRKLKLYGTAIINYDNVILTTPHINATIPFYEIRNYMVQPFRGCTLKIALKDGQNIHLEANSNFCDARQFRVFCEELDNSIAGYKAHMNQETIRELSFLERRTTFYFMVAASVYMVAMVLYGFLNGKEINIPAVLIGVSALASFWGGYLHMRARRNSNK